MYRRQEGPTRVAGAEKRERQEFFKEFKKELVELETHLAKWRDSDRKTINGHTMKDGKDAFERIEKIGTYLDRFPLLTTRLGTLISKIGTNKLEDSRAASDIREVITEILGTLTKEREALNVSPRSTEELHQLLTRINMYTNKLDGNNFTLRFTETPQAEETWWNTQGTQARAETIEEVEERTAYRFYLTRESEYFLAFDSEYARLSQDRVVEAALGHETLKAKGEYISAANLYVTITQERRGPDEAARLAVQIGNKRLRFEQSVLNQYFPDTFARRAEQMPEELLPLALMLLANALNDSQTTSDTP